MSDPRSTDEEQRDEARETRETGGDAPAAGTIEEREQVAEGDGPFGDGDETGGDTGSESSDQGARGDANGGARDEGAGERDEREAAARGDDPEVGHDAGRPPDEQPD